ncbi:MAG: FG-GAP-like repeat-containing protein [Bryobacteraceae bacterium]|jgi:uncharacterized protein (TIGR03437 family)
MRPPKRIWAYWPLLAAVFGSHAARAQVSFATPTASATQKGPIWMATGDFNGDGKLDLAVANGGSQTVAVSLGNGDGTFRTAVPYSTGSTCAVNYLAAGDFNNDGKQDLLAACLAGSEVFVFPGRGDGTFESAIATQLPIVTVTGQILLVLQPAVADFDGDGNLDIVLLGGTAYTETNGTNGIEDGAVYLLRGRGDGTFQTPQPVTAFAGTVALAFVAADFNGDGRPDLAALSVGEVGSNTEKGVTLTIALGQGDGTFKIAESYPIDFGFNLTAADVNGDGIPDLVVSGFSLPSSVALKDATAGLGVFTGNGDGTFKLAGSVSLEGSSFLSNTCLADVRGTGHPDIVVAQWAGIEGAKTVSTIEGSIALLAGNGDGTFQNPVNVVPSSQDLPVGLVCGDFNGDGRPDVAFTAIPIAGVEANIPGKNTGSLQDDAAEILGALPDGSAEVLLNTTPATTFTNTNAAGFQRGAMAQDSIVAAFGSGLASTTAQPATLTTSLGGVTVTVKDSAGASRQAELFYVSPTQINYAMPAGTATGQAVITVANGAHTATADQQIASVLPGIFAVDGIAAANVETFQNGTMTGSALAFQVAATGAITPLPIDVSTGVVYLLMYGTGIRHAASVTVNLGAQTGLPVAYSGAQGAYVGEDQINVLLPQSLQGAGVINVTLTADGQASNTVQIQIQ